jgi:hypothetical protein
MRAMRPDRRLGLMTQGANWRLERGPEARLIGFRHCEPAGRANARPMTGSAKQSRSYEKGWIASSLTLLVMTTID